MTSVISNISSISTPNGEAEYRFDARAAVAGDGRGQLSPEEILQEALGRVAGPRSQPELWQAIMREANPARALDLILGPNSGGVKTLGRDHVVRLLAHMTALIDESLNAQLNAILHHPRFQQLEASWRSLQFLVNQAGSDENVLVRMLNVSWSELERDAERAGDFDQSQIFKKVYSDEFGMAGGTPFGLLIGDYHIRHAPSADHSSDDLSVLSMLSQVAAASFAPFITGAEAALFGMESFTQLDRPMNIGKVFEQLEYTRWNKFRERDDARFVGLAMPRVLARLPYEDDVFRPDGFCFKEDVAGPDRSRYLWGNAAFAFASVVIRAFVDSGWLAEIRGVTRGEEGGGLVTNLPVHSFSTDRLGVAPKSSTEIILSDDLEKELSDLGFMPLSHCKDTEYSAFYSNQSIQKPKVYDTTAATMNSRISSMLQYILCASRIAHYLKVLGREKIGTFSEAREIEDYLTRWVHDYVAPDAEASAAVKARYPLREAQVQVRQRPGRPGEFFCTMHLLPHYQLDALTASVRLATELAPARSS